MRTASLSEATVTFNNKASIDVHENTMLQIFYSETEGLQINVGGGDIEIDTSSVEIASSAEGSGSGAGSTEAPVIKIKTTNGSTVNVGAGSKVTATTNEGSGIASFNLQEGNAEITSAESSSSVSLTKGETAKVENNGEVSKGNFAVTSISKNLRILNFEEEESVPVQIEWKASEELKSKPVIIETSYKKDFSEIVDTYKVENADNFTLPAGDGTLYWRATVETSEEETSKVDPVEGKIRVDNVEPVVATSPVDGSSYGYRSDPPKVAFNWNGDKLAANYKLEVSSTPDFAETVFEQDVMSSNASLNTLDQGTYYWRVTPYYTINNTGYAESSKVQSFTVVKNPELTPPSLSVPASDATLTYQAKDFNVTFLWKSDVKDADYKIVIAKDENFSNVVYQDSLKEKRLYKNFAETFNVGSYYWKVVRNSAEDETAAESEVRHFSVIRYVPGENRLVYPPENFSVEDIKVSSTSFMWKLADEYKNTGVESTIQISTDSDFKNIVSEAKTKDQNCSNMKLKSGRYYWRVGVQNNYEDKLQFTKPRLLNVMSELGSTQITSPVSMQEFVAMKNTPVGIKWTAVEGADYYQVSVADSTNGNKIIYDKSIRSTEVKDFIVPDYISAKQTKFRVSVQAFTEQTDISSMRQGKAVAVDFGVRTATPVKLITPAPDTKFDGLTALRKPVVLEWGSDVDKAAKATIVVRRVQSNGTLKEIRRQDNLRSTISLDRLSTGTYEWTVYASTADGLPVNAVESRRFTVGQVPMLNTPSLSEPKNNFVIGPDYLKKNRNVTFSWKAVPGATDYSFTLNLRKPDGSIKRIYSEKNIKGTTVKFKKLEALDLGDFEWNVTPYSHAKDGFEEQSGKTATGKFAIKFELPGAVQTKDPGRVYGE